MEAEESFALPKIDVIEQSLTQTTNEKSPKKAPKQEVVLEKKPANYAAIDSDAAYDAATTKMPTSRSLIRRPLNTN